MIWRFAQGLLALAVVVSCGGTGPAEQAGTQADAAAVMISRVTEVGPVKATVSVGPKEPKLGDPLTLTLKVLAAANVSVEMPAFGEALGRFRVEQFVPRSKTNADGSTEASQRYTLQAPMSGKNRIPPLRLEFVDGRPEQAPQEGEPEPKELLTEELTFEVASILPDGEAAQSLRGLRGALALRPGLIPPYVWPVLALLVLASGFLIFRAWRRKARRKVRLSAYDVALRRLAALESQGLPDPEQADEWYVELSNIVRRYLEDRFGVRAPELTTEEFLREVQHSKTLSVGHRDVLSSFLEACDRVKFAAYHPGASESGAVLAEARRFLQESRLQAQGPSAQQPQGQGPVRQAC